MNPTEISLLLEKNLQINPEKKDEFGEVNTPEHLIQQMLDKIPPKLWKDPTKKWLDPATGIGTFQIFVYERLIKGLERWEPNLTKRHQHIIQNMLYMCEINPTNVKQVKKFFGENANIMKDDFLESKHPFFNETHYDIILGNPPFNASQHANGKKGGGDSLWPSFVEKSLILLAEKGLLVFVHPASWRKPQSDDSKTKNLFRKMSRDCQIEYLEIHNKPDGLKTFGVQTRYDWYILSKTACFKKTVINDETGKIQEVDLRKWNFLPNCYYHEIRQLLSNKNNVDVVYSRNQFGTDKEWVKETESKEYKYPLVHSTPTDGPRIYWTNTTTPPVKNPVPMFGIPKVVFGESGINDIVLDMEGKYGMTQGAIGIQVNNQTNGKNLKTALESSDFERVLKAMNFGNFRIDWRMFLYFRKDFYKFYVGKGEKREKREKKSKTKKMNKKCGKLYTIYRRNRKPNDRCSNNALSLNV